MQVDGHDLDDGEPRSPPIGDTRFDDVGRIGRQERDALDAQGLQGMDDGLRGRDERTPEPRFRLGDDCRLPLRADEIGGPGAGEAEDIGPQHIVAVQRAVEPVVIVDQPLDRGRGLAHQAGREYFDVGAHEPPHLRLDRRVRLRHPDPDPATGPVLAVHAVHAVALPVFPRDRYKPPATIGANAYGYN